MLSGLVEADAEALFEANQVREVISIDLADSEHYCSPALWKACACSLADPLLTLAVAPHSDVNKIVLRAGVSGLQKAAYEAGLTLKEDIDLLDVNDPRDITSVPITHIMQAVAEADDISASVLAAVLHAAARLSAASGAQSSRSALGSAAGSSGFHAAQGARMQAFQRSLDWPQQQTHGTDDASSAVRLSSFYQSIFQQNLQPCLGLWGLCIECQVAQHEGCMRI